MQSKGGNKQLAIRLWRSGATRWVLLIAAITFGALWAGDVVPYEPVWGTISEAVAGVGTLIAVGVSMHVASRAHRLAVAVRRAEEEKNRREDAHKLSWWVREILDNHELPRDALPFLDDAHELTYASGPEGPEHSDGRWIAVCVILIKNNGDAALSDATLKPASNALNTRLRPIGLVPPGETLRAIRVLYSPTPYSLGHLLAAQGGNPGVSWIEYRDVSGRYWRRLADGTLEERSDGRLSDHPMPL
jgi:hypothetical protein